MVNSKISRRAFLKSLGIALLASGCSPTELTSELTEAVFPPTPTPLPTPTPTPLPRADAVAQAYLAAWRRDDFQTMYQLLTPDSQQRVGPVQFQDYYRRAQTEATVTAVETQLRSLLHEGPQAAVNFHSTWETALFGPIDANNQMRLRFTTGRWGIEWQPTLVLPQLGQGVALTFLSEQPTRGNIYDKNLHALATQGQMVTVGIVPQYLEDEEARVVDHVAQITGLKPEKILDKLALAQPDWFVPIADVSFETSLEYDNLLNNLPGVDRRSRAVRTYSDGDTAAHIIGYMGVISADEKEKYLRRGYQGDELVGLSGVEAWGEPYLAGQHGGRLVTLSPPPGRQVLSEIATITAKAGSSVYLTFDTFFQARVEQLLGERRGAIVVMNPHTGAIYAMASYPRFKPAVFTTGFDVDAWAKLYTNDDRPLVNRATQGTYPAGSVFKIVSLSAALEGLGLDPKTTFTCTGKWRGLGEEFEKSCWLETGHGQISLIDGLTQSCNVVFYEVGLALHRADPQLLPTWAHTFGLGASTQVLGIGESRGVVPDNAWKQETYNQPLFEGDAVNTAIGQGFVLVTPLQITRLLAAVANGGQLLRPRLVEKIVDVDGAAQPFEPEVAAVLPLSPETIALLRGSLEEITSGVRGTARQAFQDITYTVAGKTGTAESGQDTPHAWFAGYAPTDEARVAIAVLLEHGGEGSKEAAPLFRQVLEAFFEWEANQT